MKIAFVEPHLKLYGGIRRILELSNRLTGLGEQVVIYHPTGEPCDWMECRAGVRPLKRLFDSSHDVVIFNNPPDYRLVRRARARLKVFYILGLYDREKLKRFSFKIFWPIKGRMMSLKRALQIPFLKISNATWMQRFLREELSMDSELLIGGVNREVFYPAEVERRRDEFRILCSGDPREFKGTRTIQEAVELAKAEVPGLVLDTYHGRNYSQDRMAAVYSAADLFIDATWDSGSGWNNPVLEAMACRVPVICTDIGGVADFARDGRTALLVPPGDTAAMAGAIRRMLHSVELRVELAALAYEKSLEFDWDVSAKTLQTLLNTHLKQSDKPD
jgi:glycosyltransferase involved in cell wall biosynthesis